jgi:outer membrane protein assembly factor BamB
LNPSAIANRAQNMPLPNRLALPATIAAAENQRRAQAVMNDEDESEVPQPAPRKAGARVHPETTQRLRTASGTVEFATRLLEEKIVVREAMKAAPKKSALEGTVNAAATTAIANEMLNEMQRDRAGSTVEENESRYQVTVRRSSQSVPPWTGEVNGPPAMHLLKTVDVITAGKGLLVLNKNNQKLWDGKLNFPVTGRGAIEDLADLEPATDGLSSGAGPCIERAETLYVFDQGMLTSFALADGNVRWRLPSVGIAGIWFDDQGMMYLNTTTAGPDSIKYSKQIDILKKTQNQVLKVDPHTGQTLWSAQNEGLVTYIWDKYIYTAESNPGDDGEDEAGVMGMKIGLEIPAHIRLRRLDADNGRVRWEHYQQRYPLDVHFDRNTIQFLFKKEVQYLRFVVL